MSLKKSIEEFRFRRKMKRQKPHIWRIPQANAAYIQNYKVGTRSLRLAIVRYLMQQECGDVPYDDITGDDLERMDKKYSEFCTCEDFCATSPDAFIFAFVRNPLSRLYSCYANKILDVQKLGIKNQFERFGLSLDMSFDDFVRAVADIPDDSSDRHFRSQNWFVSVDGQLITNYLGKLETFAHDWAVLREKFGFPDLPGKKNVSSKGKTHFSEFYTKETYSLALERYRDDIELLGYEDDV